MKEQKCMTTVKKSGGKTELEKSRFDFWQGLIEIEKLKGTRFADAKPCYRHWLTAGIGIPGLMMSYNIVRSHCCVELYINRKSQDENQKIFDSLHKQIEEIETAFGNKLDWRRLDGLNKGKDSIACRIVYVIPNAAKFQTRKSEWPELQTELVNEMIRLEQAMRPTLSKEVLRALLPV